jgi:hypothetical protein
MKMILVVTPGQIVSLAGLVILLIVIAIIFMYTRWALYRAEKKAGVRYRSYLHGTVDDFIRNVRLGRKLENY